MATMLPLKEGTFWQTGGKTLENEYGSFFHSVMHACLLGSPHLPKNISSFPPSSAYQQGVDMNLGDYDGRTALHLAAAEGHLRCVRFLLEECKVKHDCKDRWGQTPLTEAILFKHTKVASLIRRHERTINMQGGGAKERKKKKGAMTSMAKLFLLLSRTLHPLGHCWRRRCALEKAGGEEPPQTGEGNEEANVQGT